MSRVIWRRFAFNQMDSIIRTHPDWVPTIGSAMRAATDSMARNPLTTGESRAGQYRVVVETPLTFSFRPAPEEDVVYIVEVVFHGRD
jgi:hypothetical protein